MYSAGYGCKVEIVSRQFGYEILLWFECPMKKRHVIKMAPKAGYADIGSTLLLSPHTT
jgi:hypothetical protein